VSKLRRRVLVVIIATIVMVLVYIFYPVLALDGPGGLIYPLVTKPDTRYSSGFSHRRFLRVTPGMTTSEVEGLLGPPLSIYFVERTGEAGWKYSDTVTDSSYYARSVLFRNGRVTRRLSEFYVD
jgi:hypothetical protein